MSLAHLSHCETEIKASFLPRSKRRLVCSHVIKYQIASPLLSDAVNRAQSLEVAHHVLILVNILRSIPDVHRVLETLSASILSTLGSAGGFDILLL